MTIQQENKKTYYALHRSKILADRKAKYAANRARELQKMAERRAAIRNDPQKSAAKARYFRARYLADREKPGNSPKERYRREREKRLEASRKRIANRTPEEKLKASEYDRQYYLAHKRERVAYAVKWRREQCRRDPVAALINRLRNRVYRALRACSNGKPDKTASAIALVGCTIPELMQHIKSKFLPGMTWENRREWHIDHIRPCASFDLKDSSQQRECFHYTNLQPLWAADNIRKHAKMPTALMAAA